MNKDNYESVLHEKFPYIDVLGEYVNSRTKILHRCNIHKYEWNTSPENLIRLCKYGCRICESESNNHISEKYSVNFYTELKKINPHFGDITFNTKEINGSKTIVNCTCKKCGHNWNITANALINKKSGCGRCSGAIKFDNEYFLKTLSLYNDHITPLEEYVNDETKILCKCNICNRTWKISPGKIKQGRDCPFCSKIKCINILSKSHDEFVEQMKIINPTINILGIYKNERTHIDVECDICKNIWSPTPSNLLKYRGCPICQSSNGERRVFKYLKDNNITFIPECAFDDCKDIKALPFDFYLPDYNICVEYDGEQHFRPVKFGGCSDDDAYRTHCSTVKHDKIKNEYCISHNIDLIRIPYWNYESIENILRDYLSTKRAGVNVYGDGLLNDFKDSKGNKHRGFLDTTYDVYKGYDLRYPNACDKIRLISPKKYRTQMFEELIELMDIGVIRFPYEYDGRDFVKIKKSESKDEEEFEEYELSDDEKLALVNIDLMKQEITAIEKISNKENTSVTYALSSEAVRKNYHDDRAYVLILLAHRLYELRRKNTVRQHREDTDDFIFEFKAPKKYF